MGCCCGKHLDDDDDDDFDEEVMGMTESEFKDLNLDLLEVVKEPMFKDLSGERKVTELITAENILSPYLQAIFEGNSEEAEDLIRDLRINKSWDLQYEHDIMLAFWLAVHMENVEVAQSLINYETQLRYLSILSFKGKKERNKKNDEKKRKKLKEEKERQLEAAETAKQKDLQSQMGGMLGGNLKSSLGAALQSSQFMPNMPTRAGTPQKPSGLDAFAKLMKGAAAPAAANAGGQALVNNFIDGKPSEQLEGGRDSKDSTQRAMPDRRHLQTPAPNQNSRQNRNNIQHGQYVVEDFEGGDQLLLNGESKQDLSSDSNSFIETESDNDEVNTSNYGSDDNPDSPDKKGSSIMQDESSEEMENEVSGVNENYGFDKKDAAGSREPPNIKMHDEFIYEYLKSCKLSGIDIENFEISTIHQLRKIKVGFQLRFPTFMTEIIQLLLFKDEVDLACYLTSFYELSINQSILELAIERKHHKWINYIWAFEKNYDGPPRERRPKILLKQLFRYIEDLLHGKDDAVDQIKKELKIVCDWKLDIEKKEEKLEEDFQNSEDEDEEDNILEALLEFQQDNLAIDYMGYYNIFLNTKLFLFSLKHQNQYFIKNSLKIGAFDKQIFKDDDIAHEMILKLEVGSNTNIVLNILVLIDIQVWSGNNIGYLLDQFDNFVEENYDTNRLLLSNNPLMSIALTAELLQQIGFAKKKFANRCDELMESVLELGKQYNMKNEDDDFYKMLIMDKDFQDRTILKIVVTKEFEPLLTEDDPQALNLMNNIYMGDGWQNCDGTTEGFSTLLHILTADNEPKRPGCTANEDFRDMITKGFSYNTKVDYSFQHKYRSKSISSFFRKELLFAFIIMILYVNIFLMQYVMDFKAEDVYYKTKYTLNDTEPTGWTITTSMCNDDGPICYGMGAYDFNAYTLPYGTVRKQLTSNVTFSNMKDIYRPDVIRERFEQFLGWQFTQYFVSGILGLSLVLRTIFNLKKPDEVNLLVVDKFLTMDCLFSFTSMFVFFMIQMSSAEEFIDTTPWNKKDLIDVMVMFVLVFNYSRFFILYLVQDQYSQMLGTIFAMLIDVLPFLIIMVSYIILATQITCTYWQDVNTDSYNGLFDSLTTNYNVAVADYGYTGAQQDEIIYTVWMILHLFILNILLLNFLVAILSTTYSDMGEIGAFKFKCSRYQYCERFMISFDDPDYGELVIHPPPINILCLVLLPFLTSRRAMKRLTPMFSKFVFWVENLFWIVGFIAYEMVLVVIVYLLTFYNIFYNTHGAKHIAFYVICWIPCGIPMLIFYMIFDIYNLIFNILMKHNGCTAEHTETKSVEEQEKEDKEQEVLDIRVYNQIRETLLEMYFETKRENAIDLSDQHSHSHHDDHGKENENVLSNHLNSSNSSNSQNDKDKNVDNHEENLIIGDCHIMLDNDRESEENPSGFDFTATCWMKKSKHILEKWQWSTIEKRIKVQEQVKQEEIDKKKKAKAHLLESGGIPADGGAAAVEGGEEDLIEEEDLDGESSVEEQMTIKEAIIQGHITEKEIDSVKDLLKNFEIGSEESSFTDTINITLMLQCMISSITDTNVKQLKMYNFYLIQQTLNAFLNMEIGTAFDYYDHKNSARVQGIKQTILDQKENLDEVQRIIINIKDVVQKNEELLQDFEMCSQKMKQHKIIKERQEMAMFAGESQGDSINDTSRNSKDKFGRRKSTMPGLPTALKGLKRKKQ